MLQASFLSRVPEETFDEDFFNVYSLAPEKTQVFFFFFFFFFFFRKIFASVKQNKQIALDIVHDCCWRVDEPDGWIDCSSFICGATLASWTGHVFAES
jgi:hypothetical protein